MAIRGLRRAASLPSISAATSLIVGFPLTRADGAVIVLGENVALTARKAEARSDGIRYVYSKNKKAPAASTRTEFIGASGGAECSRLINRRSNDHRAACRLPRTTRMPRCFVVGAVRGVSAVKMLEPLKEEAKKRQQFHGGTAPGKSLSPEVGEVISDKRNRHATEAVSQAAKLVGVGKTMVQERKPFRQAHAGVNLTPQAVATIAGRVLC